MQIMILILTISVSLPPAILICHPKKSISCCFDSIGYSDVQPLPWDIRLKILIGAARGLAFLHALERKGSFNQKNMGEGFYRYFKPSKILLDDVSWMQDFNKY